MALFAICPACGRHATDGALFCTACGTSLTDTTGQTDACPRGVFLLGWAQVVLGGLFALDLVVDVVLGIGDFARQGDEFSFAAVFARVALGLGIAGVVVGGVGLLRRRAWGWQTTVVAFVWSILRIVNATILVLGVGALRPDPPAWAPPVSAEALVAIAVQLLVHGLVLGYFLRPDVVQWFGQDRRRSRRLVGRAVLVMAAVLAVVDVVVLVAPWGS